MKPRHFLFAAMPLLIGFSLWSAGEATNPREANNSGTVGAEAPAPSDQIYNDGVSETSLAFSIIEGGPTFGTVDMGGNLSDDPLLSDPDGADNIPGSIDDNVDPANGSPVVDAGDDERLPPDKFDLDGDGDTTEPMPIDITGSPRSFDATDGGEKTDMGAYESTATSSGVEPDISKQSAVVLGEPFPNPLTTTGELSFRVALSEGVVVSVYDVLGRLRTVLFDGVPSPGVDHRLALRTEGLANGLYFVRLESASGTASTSFMVTR